MTEFADRWHTLRIDKGSNIIAGLDPAEFGVGHESSELPAGTDLVNWCKEYIDAVAPYVVGIKINQAYFQRVGHRGKLEEIMHVIKNHELLAISDNKIADIGNTNHAWIHAHKEFHFDALTIAPYGGNIEATIAMTHEYELAAITLGLMSNPEFSSELNFVNPETGQSLWQSRVERALDAGVDAIVVGGTYTSEDQAFIDFLKLTRATNVLYLVPGIGAQGGTIESFVASGVASEKCMINSGRAVMFPHGSASSPEEQRQAARQLRDSFNEAIKI